MRSFHFAFREAASRYKGLSISCYTFRPPKVIVTIVTMMMNSNESLTQEDPVHSGGMEIITLLIMALTVVVIFLFYSRFIKQRFI